MNDETSLWRPRPSSAYRPTGRVLTVPTTSVACTAMMLRTAGALESACFWLGLLDELGNAQVKALVLPSQVNRSRYYAVPGPAMVKVAALARPHGGTIVGAIHSHPGAGVEHSTYDDEMTPSRRAVSIVMPRYGHWYGQWPDGLGVHEYFEKYWHLLSDAHARLRVALSDEVESPVFDLR